MNTIKISILLFLFFCTSLLANEDKKYQSKDALIKEMLAEMQEDKKNKKKNKTKTIVSSSK